jgi:hypothetical protein
MPIRSPIKMDLCLACEEDAREARAAARKIKVDPIKGDLREAQIEKRSKLARDAVKRLKKKGTKKKGARKKTEDQPYTGGTSICSTISRNRGLRRFPESW